MAPRILPPAVAAEALLLKSDQTLSRYMNRSGAAHHPFIRCMIKARSNWRHGVIACLFNTKRKEAAYKKDVDPSYTPYFTEAYDPYQYYLRMAWMIEADALREAGFDGTRASFVALSAETL